MELRNEIYYKICKVLADWETQESVDDDLYNMLVEIRNLWGKLFEENN